LVHGRRGVVDVARDRAENFAQAALLGPDLLLRRGQLGLQLLDFGLNGSRNAIRVERHVGKFYRKHLNSSTIYISY
jgi:hypothetical protein